MKYITINIIKLVPLKGSEIYLFCFLPIFRASVVGDIKLGEEREENGRVRKRC